MRVRHTGRLAAISLIGASGLLLASCSSSTVPDDADAPQDGSESSVADVAAAEDFLELWLDNPDKQLLIDEPLDASVEEGLEIVYLDVGTPVSAVMWENLQAPAELLGLDLRRVETGRDAQSVNAAMNTVVEMEPDGVINITLDPVFFESQIEQLDELGAPIASGSIVNSTEFGLPEAFNGAEWMKINGGVLAANAIVRSGGAEEYVFYNVPEFPFSALELEGAQAKMDELCPSCTLRVVDIPIAELGSTASDRVVSDLQANPATEYFMAAVDEVQIGLPQKLSLAGLDVDGVAMWPAPPNYEQIANGEQDATLAVDLNLMMWTVLDQLLREIGGQDYEWPDVETRAWTMTSIVDGESVPDDATAGYIGIDDYQERFAANWLLDG
ncbi:sugar ABC transporter substrate-binding protein [Microbacterium suaedae]|uniref:sugar ABC transporter substrate-binding protein n=1 Tax=Microbacterium suaedae TaxID=2067813 RepID=UPI000DA158E4|nr:sugar ABC transporter substrate-binding protein [Microbacterium suaedae]